MVLSMEKAHTPTQVVVNILVIILRDKEQEKENIFGQMEIYMKVTI